MWKALTDALASAPWPQIISGGKDLLVVGIALAGLRTWMRQLKGTTEYQLAAKVLRVAFKIRQEITFTRTRSINSDEAKDWTPPVTNLPPEALGAMRRSYSYGKRVDELFKSEPELLLIEQEVAAILGRDKAKVLNQLRLKMRKIWSDSTVFFEAERQRLSSGGQPDVTERETREVLFGSSDEHDPFFCEVEEVVKNIEDAFRPLLR